MQQRSKGHRRLLAVAAGLALTMTACANSGGGSDGTSGDHKFTIGVSMLNMRDPDLAVMADAMKKEAGKAGVDVVIVDAKGDVSTELSQVEDLVTRKVDAVVMMPIDGEQSQTAAKLVNDADIPLFVLSTEFADGSTVKQTSYIGVDDTEAGSIQAKYLNEQLPDGGKLIYIVGTYGASWTDRRKAGFEKDINSNFDVAAEQQANGSRDEGKRVMENLLTRYETPGQIAAVVCHNDEMCIGAASAIKEADRTGEFKAIIGVDGTPPGLDAIASGEMTATVKQDSAGQGVKAIDVATSFLKGDHVDERYDLPFTLVTKDNVADFQ